MSVGILTPTRPPGVEPSAPSPVEHVSRLEIKLVTAIIQPHRLDAAQEALTAAGVSGVTVSDVVGSGRQRGHTETYRGAEYEVDLLPKLRLEVLVPSTEVERVVEALVGAGRTGRIGDGKVWVTPVETVVRIRTGELGRDAL